MSSKVETHISRLLFELLHLFVFDFFINYTFLQASFLHHLFDVIFQCLLKPFRHTSVRKKGLGHGFCCMYEKSKCETSNSKNDSLISIWDADVCKVLYFIWEIFIATLQGCSAAFLRLLKLNFQNWKWYSLKPFACVCVCESRCL